MTGEELIQFIKENHLEEYDFMVDRNEGSGYTDLQELYINHEKKEVEMW